MNHDYIENYTLTVATSGSSCKHSVQINTLFQPKFSVIIQTDRFLYKPRDKVQFRVFVFDQMMRPYQADDLSFSVEDEDGNVNQQEKITFTDFKGIHESSVIINDSSILGEWKISVTDDETGEVLSKGSFEVTDKIKDPFLVVIKARSISIAENEIKLEISGEYFPGVFVKGQATISAVIPGRKQNVVKIIEVYLPTTVAFHIADELKISDQQLVKFNVEFEEFKTGSKIMKTHEVRVCKELCREIEILKVEKSLKPGLPYSFGVVVLNDHDVLPVKAKASFYANDSSALGEFTQNADIVNRTASITFDVPVEASKLLITLENSKSSLVAESLSKASEFLKVNLVTQQ